MKKLTDLRFTFTLIAAIEAVYALAGIFTPPGMVATMPGWDLSSDGQWLAKLMGVALASQAIVAWTLRERPIPGVALALAVYQLGAGTMDWVMWLLLSDQGIFASQTGRIGVIVSIPLHYSLGLLLLAGLARARRGAEDWSAVVATP